MIKYAHMMPTCVYGNNFMHAKSTCLENCIFLWSNIFNSPSFKMLTNLDVLSDRQILQTIIASC